MSESLDSLDQIPGADVAKILCQAHGKDNAITSGEIAARLKKYGSRGVRKIVERCQQQWPFIICGAPGGGYFIPENFDEMRAYYLLLCTLEKTAKSKRLSFETRAKKAGYRI